MRIAAQQPFERGHREGKPELLHWQLEYKWKASRRKPST